MRERRVMQILSALRTHALLCPALLALRKAPISPSRSRFHVRTLKTRENFIGRRLRTPKSTVLCSFRRSVPRPSMAPEKMVPDCFAGLRESADEFPPPSGVVFSYGTSGFRTDASLLHSTVFRIGVLAALRSLRTKKATGLVITASHNPIADNGVKLADPGGGMLAMEWEEYANMLANAGDADDLLLVVRKILDDKDIMMDDNSEGGRVLLARDTRPSGAELLAAAKKGVQAVKGVVVDDRGVLTTPQLHWMVRAYNRRRPNSKQDYYGALSSAFASLLELKPSGPLSSEPILVDGANGVGAGKLAELQKRAESLELIIRNAGDGVLNSGVGADHVQKGQVLPQNFDSSRDGGRKCVSIDGDADRLVYFYYGRTANESRSRVHVLDGDKVMALFATFIKEQLTILAEAKTGTSESMILDGYGTVTIGAAQTAYANGASTKHLQNELQIEVGLTPTGVKHLHETAATYDVGFYFEANGHGTILLKESLVEWLKDAGDGGRLSGEKLRAARRILAVGEVMNQAVGDAFSGILMVEAVLRYRGWSVQEWDAIYEDLPSRQLKVSVAARALITTTAAETKVTAPVGLQEAIDAEVARHRGGRSFARPSGTEDVVRVYAEAETQECADVLAFRVCDLVHDLAGGVGPSPRPPHETPDRLP